MSSNTTIFLFPSIYFFSIFFILISFSMSIYIFLSFLFFISSHSVSKFFLSQSHIHCYFPLFNRLRYFFLDLIPSHHSSMSSSFHNAFAGGAAYATCLTRRCHLWGLLAPAGEQGEGQGHPVSCLFWLALPSNISLLPPSSYSSSSSLSIPDAAKGSGAGGEGRGGEERRRGAGGR